MGTFHSFRKAYGALKDSTKVGLAKVNSEFKDLDIAVVKATNHVEGPPKERHVRKIFSATSVLHPRADVAYCIHALARRLSKTRNWIVAIKTLIVIHRTLREGDPTFREELLNYSHRGHILQISNFKDDSSPLAWDCSAWVRTYALFLEERLECFRILKYDIETERLTKTSPGSTKVHSRTRLLSGEELLEQLPALQQLLFRLIGCQPEGAAYHNYLIQYALALVLKESFKIYCAINDGIINLVDMFFDMSKHDAVKALNIYKRAGQQAEQLAEFYEFCKGLDLARNFQFPTLRQPPPSFLSTMEEYIKEAPQTGSVSNRRLEYQETNQEPDKPEEPAPEESEEKVKEVEEAEDKEPMVDAQEEPHPKSEDETPPLISTEDTGDLLGLNEINPKAAELEEGNAMALAIIPPGGDPLSTNRALAEIGNTSGWELALVTTPSNINNNQMTETKLAGGFDKLLLDSLYEDDTARRQIQLQNAGYNTGYGYGMPLQNSFEQQDPFAMSSSIAPPTNVQMAIMAQQQQQHMMMQQQQQHQQQNMLAMVPHQYPTQYPPQQEMPNMGSANPFGDPFSYPQSTMPPQGNHTLL
ncbi:putative clathrin assembly protein At5g57200 [Cornus florida]|uniref:putative clathrin assembly protein At5g57200 n=1 Tax=Cornus florida TaxID=4283 RepID=UPI002897C14B|nr:putative clathrin assembly protein At5g57200 [Cornus florida]